MICIKDDQGKTIGFKKNLVYKGKGPNTHPWLMKEYHLHGVSLQPSPKLNDYVLCRIRKKDDGKKQNNETIIHDPRFDTEASSRCQRIGGNQDGEGFSSFNCAENPILGRKRPRIEFMMDYELPNLSVADAAIMVESIVQDPTTDSKEPRIDGDQHTDLLGTKNCVPALSEGVSKSFMQDDEAKFLRGLSPILEKFWDEDFEGMLWTESEAEQMGDPQDPLQDLEMHV
ncbi:NAC domain-containing protein [Actinidia chinensis var. chinensis]|uniref:NAC domain-containing protein n=1 Tax=Actinidia chinensis var. chinensis TaxID=1590841 RepID=A0A2R6QPX0_ACTCC|nr:NAC domain-containing protein [Actinidia chinensis var. chinensis]